MSSVKLRELRKQLQEHGEAHVRLASGKEHHCHKDNTDINTQDGVVVMDYKVATETFFASEIEALRREYAEDH